MMEVEEFLGVGKQNGGIKAIVLEDLGNDQYRLRNLATGKEIKRSAATMTKSYQP